MSEETNTGSRCVDLHVHTNYSDGAFSPAEAVRYAAEVGLAAVAITDHDTVAGIPSALEEGRARAVEVVPGVELSTEVDLPEKSEMHILGYFIAWENVQFQESLRLLREAREKRARQILNKLAGLGVRLDEERLFRIAGKGAIGRLHFAKAMIEEGAAANINEAFSRYLGIGRAAYVPKLRLRPEEAIRMILRIGGVPVLAHPYYGHYSNRNLLKGLVRDGLRGIEVWHSKHPPKSVELFRGIASEMGLVSTGGSDCHGSFAGEPPIMGTVKVSYDALEQLKSSKRKLDHDNRTIFDKG